LVLLVEKIKGHTLQRVPYGIGHCAQVGVLGMEGADSSPSSLLPIVRQRSLTPISYEVISGTWDLGLGEKKMSRSIFKPAGPVTA
jgi:hypothetical protein